MLAVGSVVRISERARRIAGGVWGKWVHATNQVTSLANQSVSLAADFWALRQLSSSFSAWHCEVLAQRSARRSPLGNPKFGMMLRMLLGICDPLRMFLFVIVICASPLSQRHPLH